MGIYRKEVAIDGISPGKLEDILKDSDRSNYPILEERGLEQAQTHLKDMQNKLFRTRDHMKAIQKKLEKEFQGFMAHPPGESNMIEPESTN